MSPLDDRSTPVIPFGPRARREAATYGWKELTPLQQRAIVKCHARLSDIGRMKFEESRPRTGAGRFLPAIDEERLNNTVLIDGRRGSGKTAVLFSLLRYWMRNMPEMEGFLPNDDATRQRDKQLTDDINASVEAEEGKDAPVMIVPIGPIDLQYLPETTQIIPLIAGAFNDVLQAIHEVRGLSIDADRIESPWMTLPSESAANIVDLHREFVDAASAWEIDTRERHRRLDPEDYTIEMSTMEAKRSKVQKRFRAFGDALYRDFRNTFRGKPGTPPLFVLCIDDADMKPRVSTRLLEAFRVLYHPRIAFLLTGDTYLFLNELSDNWLASLRSPLRRIELQADQADEANDRSSALRLAREVYDKIIPTSHRVELSEMSPLQRRWMLAEVLGRIRPTKENKPTPPQRGRVDWYLEHDPYTRNALPPQVRDMLSLNDFVSEWDEREDGGPRPDDVPAGVISHPSLPIRVVRKLWIDSLGDSLLNRVHQEMLHNVIRFETLPYFRFYVDNSMLRKNTLAVPLRTLPLRDHNTLSLRQIVGYEMHVRDGDRDVAILSSPAEGALILATDLAADEPDGDFVAPSLSPDEFDNPFVTAGIRVKGLRGVLDVVWPLPDWDSFVDFHLFSNAWTAIVAHERHRTRDDETLIEQFALRFVWLVTQMANRDFVGLKFSSRTPEEVIVSGVPEAMVDLSKLTWKSVVPKVVQMIGHGKATSRENIMAEWAESRAVLIAAPESKLPRGAAADFIDEFAKAQKTSWQSIRPDIEDARHTRIMKSYVHSGKERGTTVEEGGADGMRKLKSLLSTRDAIASFILEIIDRTATKRDPWTRRATTGTAS